LRKDEMGKVRYKPMQLLLRKCLIETPAEHFPTQGCRGMARYLTTASVREFTRSFS